jgi:phosphate uptake regulator
MTNESYNESIKLIERMNEIYKEVIENYAKMNRLYKQHFEDMERMNRQWFNTFWRLYMGQQPQQEQEKREGGG